jgi:fumarylacetoacetase
VNDAEELMFGMVLLNDWSARDIQQWEYVPLGPFNAKTFATSISPWVVTMEALEPFRVPGPTQEPEPLPYLRQSGDHSFDIQLSVELHTAECEQPTTICNTNYRSMYWSMAQQLAHHTISGCNVRVGDLMASGTISGTQPDSFGSLLELSWNGQRPVTLIDGQTKRSFLEDGDVVTLRGACVGAHYRCGFGTVSGRVIPALTRG